MSTPPPISASTQPPADRSPTPEPTQRFLELGSVPPKVIGQERFLDFNQESDEAEDEANEDDSREDLFETELELPQIVAASGFEAVSASDFASIGLSEHETRVTMIRSAARRASNNICADPAFGSDRVGSLSEIVWATYRLVDPRYRTSTFQQIRVGRILPLVLSHAACMDLISESGVASNGAETPDTAVSSTPILFGHPLPVVVPQPSSPAETIDPITEIPQRGAGELVPRLSRIGRKRSEPTSSEAMEAFGELRSFSTSRRWQKLIRDSRVVITLATAASIAAVMLFVAVRHSTSTPASIADTADTTVVKPIAPIASSPSTSVQPTLIAGSSVEGTPIETKKTSPAKIEPLESPEPSTQNAEPAASDPTSPATIDEHENNDQDNSLVQSKPRDELIRALAEATNRSQTELLEQFEAMLPKRDVDSPGDAIAQPRSPAVGPPVIPSLPDDEPTQSDDEPTQSNVEPTASTRSNHPNLNQSDVITLADEIWRATPSAARQFTVASVSALIDQWDLNAELAGLGTLEHAAATRLSLQAAWLVDPFSKIVHRLQASGPIIDGTPTSTAPSDSASCHLDLDSLKILADSWQTARKRVVITSDLNQMLHQGTVLIDRILVSDQLSPSQRFELFEPLLVDAKRLALLAKDKSYLAEFSELTAAMESFPDASELVRLEASDEPSGFLGRIRCLKQRQWEAGLPWLAKTNEPALASCASAEWQLQQSDSVSEEQLGEIADRWTKIALRLPAREAAAVRLHAIKLYGDSTEYSKQREDLIDTLPSYLRELATR